MAAFPALQHVAITVSDLDRSMQFYGTLFGADPALDEDEESGRFHHVVYVLGGGQMFGLHTHTEPGAGAFDERNAGLDHVSFACSDRAELQRWVDRLDSLGIAHGGIKDAHYGSGLSFRDPDNIALEFFAPAG